MHKSAEEIFAAALVLTNPADRVALLDRECAGNPALRAEVESLLAAHEQARNFLENPPAAVVAETLAATTGTIPVTEQPGDNIGRYKLLQKLGEGGCGVVYMAEQEKPIRRRVALKVIKLGMDTRQVIARFEAERQALAMMDHPNIAKVLDAGATVTGRPYFVMEMVRGFRITDYCDQNNLSTRARLDLFIEVCQAIQHAHQKGIIHRDIKPSNILVTLHDGVPVPKVIDFGIAKATEGRLTDKTLFTDFQQFIGTPAYMSPEQTEMSGIDIDTRSDTYALGVLLYELLTAQTPFDAKELFKAGLDEMRRKIKEDEPPRPSMRLTTLTDEELHSVAKHRQSEPPTLITMLRRDLDWIVMKALEKDRTRRYETANGLGDDVRRYLNQEPVAAAPPSAGYRVRKFTRRHRTALVMTSALIVLLVVGVAVSTWQAIRATRAERTHIQLRHLAEQHASAEALERARAEETTTRIELQTAERLFAGDDAAAAVAHLARLLRRQPTNRVAAERLLSALSQRPFLLPIGESLEHEGGFVPSAQFSSDGRRVLLIGRDTAHIFDAETGLPLVPTIQLEGYQMARGFSPDGKWVVSAARERDGMFGVWAWDCTVSNTPSVRGLMPHDQPVLCLDFSPDATRVATGSSNGIAQIWRVGDWTPITGPLQHTGAVTCVVFSPDGERLATGAETNGSATARVWDSRTGEPLTAPFRFYRSFFEPNGRLLLRLLGSNLGEHLKLSESWIWNRPDTLLRETLGKDVLSSADVSLDGQRLVTMRNRQGLLWDLTKGVPLGEPIPSSGSPQDVHFSPDCQRVVVAFMEGSARVYDANSGQPLSERLMHQDVVTAARFSPEGRRILTASFDKTARLWDAVPRPKPAVILEDFSDESRFHAAVQFSPDSQRVVTGAGRLQVWDAHSGQSLAKSEKTNDYNSISYSPDGRLLLARSGDDLCVLDAQTLEPLTEPFRFREIRESRFNSDGTEVVAWSVRDGVMRWDVRTGQPLGKNFATKAPWGESVGMWSRLSPDGRKLIIVTGSSGEVAENWDAKTGQRVGSPLLHDERLSGFPQFSRDGEHVVTVAGDSVRVWDLSNGRLLQGPFRHLGPVLWANLSPDGECLATCSADKTARLWNLRTGHAVPQPLQHAGVVHSVHFSPDSTRVVTASEDGTARVWDVETGHPLSEPMQHGFPVDWAVFSPDGRQVNTFSSMRTSLWDVYQVPGPVPPWLPAMAEAIVGQRLGEAGVTEFVPARYILRWRREPSASTNIDFYSRWARWFFADPTNRTVAFQGTLTQTEYIQRLLKVMMTQDGRGTRLPSMDDVKTALQLDPTNIAAITFLARQNLVGTSVGNTQLLAAAAWQTRRALSLAPDDLDLWQLWTDVLGNWRDIDAVTGLKEADRMVKSQPNHPGPWLAKGIFLARPAPTIVESLPDGGVRKTYNRPVRYEEAQRAFSEGIQHALRATNERHVLLNLLRLHRAEVFRELGQLPEAAQDIAAALGIRRRDPQTPNRLVDLSAFYSAPLVECWTNWGFAEIRSPSLDLVPGSRQMFAGVEFDVRGVLMPGGIAPANSLACTYARSIPVNLACRRLHFLHATLRASNVGAQVGTYWVHCQDGRTESIPIEYGADVLGWKDESAQSQPPFRASVAWMSKDHNGAVLRLYKSTWTNPRPDVPVVSLDFSREQGDASLFLVSVTAESVESERLAGNLR